MAQTGALSMVLVYNLVVAPRWLAGEQARHTRCDLPLCGRYEHNEGRWMSLDRHKNARRPPPCCGWDKYKWGGQENGRWMFKDDVEHCGDVPMATDPELLGGSTEKAIPSFLVVPRPAARERRAHPSFREQAAANRCAAERRAPTTLHQTRA